MMGRFQKEYSKVGARFLPNITVCNVWFCCLAIALFAPAGVVAGNTKEHVIVINSNDDSLSLINPETYKEVKRIPIGKGPHHLLPTPDNNYLIVGNTMSNELVIINPLDASILKRIPRIADPYHIGFSLDGRYFVTNGNRLDHVDLGR